MTRWERLAEWPLMAAAVLFLAAYAWPILDPGLQPAARTACSVTVWATWAFFAIDYFVRLAQSTERIRFVRRNVLDLLVIALPLLRPLRLLRLVTLLRVLNRTAAANLRGRVVTYVLGGSVLVAFVGALAMLRAERGQPESHIQTFGDAIWWAMVTMTTVGYGDVFPVTTTGRLVAGGLMVAGIAMLGVVTATFASWLVQSVAEETRAEDELRREIARLREAMEDRWPAPTQADEDAAGSG